MYDVTAYGATGNGTTDDRAAIQAAINAAAAAGGGTVYFPNGTYLVGFGGTAFTVTHHTVTYTPALMLAANVHLRCDAGTVIKTTVYSGTAEKCAIGANQVDGWSIEGFVLDGAETGTNGEAGHHAVVAAGCSNWRVSRNECRRFRGKFVNSLGTNGANVGLPCAHYWFTDNYVHDIGGNALGYNGVNRDFVVSRNEIHDNSNLDAGAEIFLGGPIVRARIVDNVSTNFGNIATTGATDTIIAGNTVVTPARAQSGAIGVNGTVNRLVIANNTVDTSATLTGLPSIFVYDGTMSSVVIADNVVTRGSAHCGIATISNALNISQLDVTGNTVRGGAAGVEASIRIAYVDNAEVSHNVVTDAENGIYVSWSCARVNAVGNSVRGGRAIYEPGSGGSVVGGHYESAAGNAGALRVLGAAPMTVTGVWVKASSSDTATPAIQLGGGAAHVVTGCYVEQTGSNQRWIAESGTPAAHLITGNRFAGIGGTIVAPSATIRNNTGYVTEASGSVAVVGSATVTHGLSVPPTKIFLTPTADTRVWATTLSTTQFTINVSTLAPVTVSWRAEA